MIILRLRNAIDLALAVALGCVSALLLGIGTARAAPNPPGSYTQTCRDIFVNGTSLVASCKDFHGNWPSRGTTTTLQTYTSCVGDIFNSGGRLTCALAKPPPGSYQKTCNDLNFDANQHLNAQCRDFSGNLVATGLDTKKCRDDISNVDSHLNCNTGSVRAPAGSYLQTCWNVVADASSLSATCRTSNGGNKGKTVLSGLSYSNCIQSHWEIVNQEGSLGCQTPPIPPIQCPPGNPNQEPNCGPSVVPVPSPPSPFPLVPHAHH